MRAMGVFSMLLVLAPWIASARRQAATAQANPIRKVVTMLQMMQQKVGEEGEKEKELYEKFMCYCSTGKKELQGSIGAAETKVSALISDIKETDGTLAQLKADLEEAMSGRAAAKETIASATAQREKENAAHSAEKVEYETNIAAIKKAVAALEGGVAGSFLQTEGVQILQKLASTQDMPESDRKMVTSFLSGSQSARYAPQSGQIIGILKQMGDEMSKGLSDSLDVEAESFTSFESLTAAKNKEIKALQATIESKQARIGETGVTLATMKEDLTDTKEALANDNKFIAGLDQGCKTKAQEWEERSKTRADELVALADTIKVLNDDDSLELFKKTLPSASSSFVQLGFTRAAMRQRALNLLRRVRATSHSQPTRLDLLVLALSGRKAASQGTFDKVIAMIDEMVQALKKEQQDDDDKKEYCAKQFDVSDDKKKALERTVSDKEHAIGEAQETISRLTEEIASLEKGIKDLDISVAEATEQRKNENVEFKELMASNGAAKELLGFAKNRLNKFYNPKLYKPPPKAELGAEERIAVNMGSEAAPTTTPSGIAGTGIKVLAQVKAHTQRAAPAPPPGTWGAYTKKTEENNGVLTMIDLLIKDLDKEMTEAETAEKDAQADYEVMMNDAADKRAADSKSLTEKGSAKANSEASLEDHTDAHSDAAKELMATEKYIHSLHTECDWLLKYFDARKELRAGEIDSLGKAKAVLSGADYSFL